jgi:hypothetical protein
MLLELSMSALSKPPPVWTYCNLCLWLVTFVLVLLVVSALVGCTGFADGDDRAPETDATWCCEVKASDGNTRFSRFCGITEEDAISWMRDPLEVCWDDAE